MRMSILFGMALSMSALAAQPDPVSEGLKKLQGKWVEVYLESAGKDLDKVAGKKARGEKKGQYVVTVVGEKWITKPTQASEEVHTFKIDPTRKPMQIDWTVTLDDETLRVPGIYLLEGDTLKVCYPFPFGGDFSDIGKRPTEFKTSPRNTFLLKIFKRHEP